MNLGDFLSEDAIEKLAKQTVEIGSVYRITMDQTNGITPKQGDISRDKFFIVLGFDNQGNIYGGVIVNSKINQNVSQNIKDLQYPIQSEKYKFLSYNSFVDCSTLKVVKAQFFASWIYLGDIFQDDLDLIIETVKSSPNESKMRLKQFGLQ